MTEGSQSNMGIWDPCAIYHINNTVMYNQCLLLANLFFFLVWGNTFGTSGLNTAVVMQQLQFHFHFPFNANIPADSLGVLFSLRHVWGVCTVNELSFVSA